MRPADDEWTFPNRATPLGSPSYYAVRFSPEHLRERYALLLGWHQQIDEIADRPHDPGVARIKLDWWRNEIATLQDDGDKGSNDRDGRGRHPLTIALSAHAIDDRTGAHLADVVQAAEQSIVDPQPTTNQAFADRCRGVHGQFFAALAAATPSEPCEPEACIEAGAYCAAVEGVRRLAQHPHRLPAALSVDALRSKPARQRTQELDALLALFDVSPAAGRHAMPGIIRRLVALSNATHQKLKRKGYPVLDTLVDRPPIAHLWTAWRCR